MPAHSDSRSSTPSPELRLTPLPVERGPSSPSGRTSWNPYPLPDELEARASRPSREAMPPPPARDSNPAAARTRQLAESIASFSGTFSATPRTEAQEDERPSPDGLADTVKRFAREMQQKIARLGGRSDGRESAPPARTSIPGARNSLANVLDAYRPERDVVAPISVRPNAMELLWVCGDCGQHYPRARECPEVCTACGAPKQHFYAPVED